MQGRWLLEPALAPQPPWIGKLSFVFSLTAVVGLGAAALALPNGVRNPAGGIAAAEPPLNLYPSEPPLNLYPRKPNYPRNRQLSLHAWWSKANTVSSMRLYRSVFRSRTRREENP